MNEILIYGEIGTDVKDSKVVDQLSKFSGEPVRVRVNSPGGDVYAGLAIMNALRGHDGEVTAVIEGLAASAASFVAIGGADRTIARPSAEVMIHNAWMTAAGNSDELVKLAGDLKRISENMANIYAEKAGGDPGTFREMMRAETWFSAQEALEVGLIDAIEDARQPAPEPVEPANAKVMASFRYRSRSQAPPPEVVARRSESPTENTEPDSGQTGDKVSILNQLAQELGREPEEVQGALSGIFNEVVEVKTPVSVEFPDEVKVVPTGKVEVTPSEPLPSGAVSEAEIGEGFTVEVNEDGTVTVRASDQVKVDDTTDLTLTIGDATVTVKVVVEAADSEDETPDDDGTPVDPAVVPESGDIAEFGEVPAGYALVPQAHLDDLTARARMGDEAFTAKAEADLEAEVDGWVQEGRFAVGRRQKVVADMKTNPDLARRTWGALPKGSIPRSEIGYGVDSTDPEDTGVPTVEELRAKAQARLSGNNKK